MVSNYKRGWFKESYRHYLAAKGVTTNQYFVRRGGRRMRSQDVFVTPPAVPETKTSIRTPVDITPNKLLVYSAVDVKGQAATDMSKQLQQGINQAELDIAAFDVATERELAAAGKKTLTEYRKDLGSLHRRIRQLDEKIENLTDADPKYQAMQEQKAELMKQLESAEDRGDEDLVVQLAEKIDDIDEYVPTEVYALEAQKEAVGQQIEYIKELTHTDQYNMLQEKEELLRRNFGNLVYSSPQEFASRMVGDKPLFGADAPNLAKGPRVTSLQGSPSMVHDPYELLQGNARAQFLRNSAIYGVVQPLQEAGEEELSRRLRSVAEQRYGEMEMKTVPFFEGSMERRHAVPGGVVEPGARTSSPYKEAVAVEESDSAVKARENAAYRALANAYRERVKRRAEFLVDTGKAQTMAEAREKAEETITPPTGLKYVRRRSPVRITKGAMVSEAEALKPVMTESVRVKDAEPSVGVPLRSGIGSAMQLSRYQEGADVRRARVKRRAERATEGVPSEVSTYLGQNFARKRQRLTAGDRIFGAGMLQSMRAIDRMANSKYGEPRARRVR
jgi:hypothetical protein